MAKVAVKSLRNPKTHATAGNFVGVCPVIGRGGWHFFRGQKETPETVASEAAKKFLHFIIYYS